MFKCFVEETLHIDDVVVYLKNIRTGSSTIKKCKFVSRCISERTHFPCFPLWGEWLDEMKWKSRRER